MAYRYLDVKLDLSTPPDGDLQPDVQCQFTVDGAIVNTQQFKGGTSCEVEQDTIREKLAG